MMPGKPLGPNVREEHERVSPGIAGVDDNRHAGCGGDFELLREIPAFALLSARPSDNRVRSRQSP